jgi:carbon monoxide dehydrogenase subunit G
MALNKNRFWLTSDSCPVHIAATPEQVYALISDMPRMGEWSPECRQVEWADGSTIATVGARFVGHNRSGPGGLLRWSTRGRVLTADPGLEFAFVTEGSGGRESTVWRYRFERVDGGTRVTESYEVRWIPMWLRIIDVPTNRDRQLREAMAHTLRQLKAAAEWTPQVTEPR